MTSGLAKSEEEANEHLKLRLVYRNETLKRKTEGHTHTVVAPIMNTRISVRDVNVMERPCKI